MWASQFRALLERVKKIFFKSIEIYQTNKKVKNYQNIFQKREGGFFERFVGVGVRVAKFFYWQVARNLLI